jgi:putative Holliday junction resolvase
MQQKSSESKLPTSCYGDRMVCMGIDVGTRRIGVAISDPLGMIAQPLTTLEAPRGGGVPLDALRAIVEERGVERIVVGLPLRMDGSHGPEAQAAAAIAEEIGAALRIEVVLEDERLSSVEAERLLIEAGVRRQERKGTTDRVAAAIILQSHLDGLAGGRAGGQAS